MKSRSQFFWSNFCPNFHENILLFSFANRFFLQLQHLWNASLFTAEASAVDLNKHVFMNVNGVSKPVVNKKTTRKVDFNAIIASNVHNCCPAKGDRSVRSPGQLVFDAKFESGKLFLRKRRARFAGKVDTKIMAKSWMTGGQNSSEKSIRTLVDKNDTSKKSHS